MNKDLFQINQMHDIYFTMNLWSLLSPDLREEKENTAHKSSGWKKTRKKTYRKTKQNNN